MKYLILILCLGSLVACSDVKKSEQLSSIDKMHISLDSIQTVLFENEIDTIAALQVATNTVELRIKNNYYADTIDMELGKKMDAYKIMRRTLSPLGKSFSVIKNGVIDEKETLDKLKSDIEKGNGERNKYNEFVLFENSKVEQLRSLLNDYIAQKEKTMKTFHDLHDELNAFSMSLLEKKKKVQ
jgi:hypothetical protein